MKIHRKKINSNADDQNAELIGTNQESEVLIQVRDLKKYFPIHAGLFNRRVGAVRAVDGVSFDIFRGETLGLVGESGCGKSTTGLTLLHLLPPTDGTVTLNGQELSSLGPVGLREARRDMQIIFQDPYASLNPRMTVGRILREPLLIHNIGDAVTREKRVQELLDLVGLPAGVINRYPHEFSGGQQQRIGIARCLATQPAFIVADEPISALDVSIQAQIINLLNDLKKEFNLTYLFIAHDLSMVRFVSQRVAVMYLGQIVELSESEHLFDHPLHPYTQALIASIPIPDPDEEALREDFVLEGDVPSPEHPPGGCHFHTRCPYATEHCSTEKPQIRDLGNPERPHLVACHYAEEITPLSNVLPST
jgi:oligopeptide transport system ATP-binding protein